ncbi:MAG: bifunctional histidinol-phosphatase/imidazoleglycerol-phosphate dehydratase HisB [Bacteroidetes bacterium]|nr:bifunctional histidinol-phosphatase/imidazoleglycerol-phosphate dehydratase HisB [Bacteroidota bacterium]MDA1122083.1 bifunctional histidinol-phosphatase/imidazoleglycerol-phosphate dehydratase HisB [Bacteroidota bacterium]
MKKKVLFIDRDGTIIVEPQPDQQVDSFDKLDFVPGSIVGLHRIATELDYELVMVTNQDGLGTDSFPEDTFWPAHNMMLRTLESEGIHFTAIHIDKSFEKENNPNRKPRTGMLMTYLNGDYDLENSFVIGDRLTDVELAKNLGSKAIHFSKSPSSDAEFGSDNWKDIYKFLKSGKDRVAQVSRNTNETQISIKLNLDGNSQASISTGIGFFDHMLEQVAKHSGCDLEIVVKGDLQIDEHHTIEDTGIALGEAFLRALGDKRGIARYGFLLPMDEALAQVAIDFSGRPWLVWEAEFKREKVGEMPTEMFFHFFKSFCDAAKCNLNVKVEGDNEHHKIEAIFKAFAKALKIAIKVEGNQLPSTKGVL